MKRTILVITALVLLSYHGKSKALPKIKCVTNFGVIIIELDTLRAPLTSKNFLAHVKKGTYKNALFYRVVRVDNQPQNKIKIEVIQGGLLEDAEINKIPPIAHESTNQTGIKHLDGTISMARMEPGTASTEFFICVGDQPELDFGGKRNHDGQGFAAFGQVIEGMNVVRKIHMEKDTDQMLDEPIHILEMKILQ